MAQHDAEGVSGVAGSHIARKLAQLKRRVSGGVPRAMA